MKKITILFLLFFCHVMLNSIEMNVNGRSDFADVIPQQTVVFSVGNDNYSNTPFWTNLDYSWNDAMLLKQILIQCCKVAPGNIYSYRNTGKEELFEKMALFLNSIPEDSMVIIFFSGHGSEDGSFICTDGEALSPMEIREIINSFNNDTVLIIDACYSGENERIDSSLPPFKENSMRLYSSLGFLMTPEVIYADNTFFKYTKSFYENVLGLIDFKGNSYFMALMGNFFAHYKMGENNISFFNMASYITGRGKQYFEYLGKTKNGFLSYIESLDVSMETLLPKIEPIDTQIQFKNPNHLYLIYKKKTADFRPEKNYFSMAYTPSISIPRDIERHDLFLLSRISFLYNLNFQSRGIIGLGMETGFNNLPPQKETVSNLYFIPLAFKTHYQSNFLTPFYFQADVNAGPLFIWDNKPALLSTNTGDGAKEDMSFYSYFFFAAGIGAGINPSKRLGVSINFYVNFFSNILVFSPGMTISYNF